MRRAALLLALGLLAGGCEADLEAHLAVDPPALAARADGLGVSVAPIDSQLARLHPLEPRWWSPGASMVPFTVGAQAGYSLNLVRTLDGWELLDGVPQARVSYRLPRGRGMDPMVVEWLRPEGATLLVTRRLVGGKVQRIEPPLPCLKAPLSEGQNWSWEGTIDGAPARVDVTVRRQPLWRGRANVWAIEHVARLGRRPGSERLDGAQGEQGGRRTVFLLPGLGMVGEEGSYFDAAGTSSELGAWRTR